MEAWVSAIIEVLCRNGLAVVPLAVLVAGICRWVPSRPATRHTLWLLVLLWLVVLTYVKKAGRETHMTALPLRVPP